MRAAVYEGAGVIRLAEMDVPVRGPGELLVRVRACGLCGSDLTGWYQDPRAPMVMGHEPVGVVLEADPDAPWRAGDRVFVHHHVPCMTCRRCRAGRHTLCDTFTRTRIDPGGLAEVIRVPADNVRLDVLALPDGVSDPAATFIEPLGCVIHGLRTAGVGAGTRVAVVGTGAMGLLQVQACRALGAGLVVAVEPDPARRALAAGFGAHDPGALGTEGADVVLVTASSPAALADAIDLAGPGGVVQLFAPPRPGHPVPVDLSAAWFREVSITGTYSAGPFDTRDALELIATGRVRVEELVSHRVPLARVQEGFDLAASGVALKVVVDLT